MSSDNDSKVQSETLFTIIAGIVGLVALIGLICVLCLLRRRHQQHQLRRQQQQQQGTTTRASSRAKPRMSRKRQQSASSLRRQQQQYVLSTPSQPEDTYSIDSSSTMIELQQRFHGSGLRSVESNSSFMADMFSITSDMLMQQSSPTSATLSPQQPASAFNSVDHINSKSSPKRPPMNPSFGNKNNTNYSSESIFATNFAILPISKSSDIILNNQNDNSTAGDDNDDDFDEVWSYVATDVDIELLNDGGNNDDIQSIMTYDENVIRDNTNTTTIPPTLSATLTDPQFGGSRRNTDNDDVASSIIHQPKFIGRSADCDRNLFEV